jgi:hypothetical protein
MIFRLIGEGDITTQDYGSGTSSCKMCMSDGTALIRLGGYHVRAVAETGVDRVMLHRFILPDAEYRNNDAYAGIYSKNRCRKEVLERVFDREFGYATFYTLLSGGYAKYRYAGVDGVWGLFSEDRGRRDRFNDDMFLICHGSLPVSDSYVACSDWEAYVCLIYMSRNNIYRTSLKMHGEACDEVLEADRIDKIDMLMGIGCGSR